MSELSLEYAQALYELASSKQEKEVLLYNLNEFNKVLSDEDILKFLCYPEISIKKKKELIDMSLKKDLFRRFIYTLLDNRRIELMGEIREDFEKLYYLEFNLLKVFVYSKVELTKEYINKLKEKLEIKTSKNVLLENVIDKSITAGIRIEYESNIIDLTVDKKFNDLINDLKR